MKVIIITKSNSFLGEIENIQDATKGSWLCLNPSIDILTEEESVIIETNTGIQSSPIHYPMSIKLSEIGGIIDVENPPLNPLEKDETENTI